MYCFGDCRSETFSFSPRASRSRSRWRIFSRSSATDFMRLSSTSGDSSGMASVSTVATAATAAQQRGDLLGAHAEHQIEELENMVLAQKSKLIILLHDEDADAHPAWRSRPS